MADHRAEQILAAVKTTLSNVNSFETLRAPLDALSNELQEVPAVCIFMGEDPLQDDDGFQVMGSMRSIMTVNIDLWDQADRDTNIETKLNQLRKDVHIALMATPRLGLSFVIDFRPFGADEPDLSPDGEAITGMRRTIWIAEYNSSVTDPST